MAYPDANLLRVYNFQQDPTEKHVLAHHEKMKPTIADLFSRLIALQRKINDDLELGALAPQ